jgi:uncharacterized protein
MPQVRFASTLPVSPALAFAWHARPGALHRLLPPWSGVRVLSTTPAPGADSVVRNGGRVELSLPAGPFKMRWIALHKDYQSDESFTDVMERGPLARWTHCHRFTPTNEGCTLTDEIDYTPGFPAQLASGRLARDIARTFAFRHARTRDDLARHLTWDQKPLTIAITGASGLVGSALVPFLTTGGHRVLTIGRSGADIRWDPARGLLDASALNGVDAVIHLAGENVAQRWDNAAKQRIADSRVLGTALIARTLAAMSHPPAVLVCASGIGAYGTHDDDGERDENAPFGSDFLAGVCRAWEDAAEPARAAGIRHGVVVCWRCASQDVAGFPRWSWRSHRQWTPVAKLDSSRRLGRCLAPRGDGPTAEWHHQRRGATNIPATRFCRGHWSGIETSNLCTVA